MRSLHFIASLTLVLVIGLYVGAYLAYQKYQEKSDALKSNPIGTVAGLLG